MKKQITVVWLILLLCISMAGCGEQEQTETTQESTTETSESSQELEDGIYIASFETDSSMFHVNEADEGKGTLTVEDGQMTIHVRLVSKNIVQLYAGTAEDAQKDGAELIDPVTETVTYSDGYEEEVYAFDIPVPELEKEFDVALIGKKGKWYDHKVSVSDPEESTEEAGESQISTTNLEEYGDGEYTIEVTMEGGTGRASITSPAVLNIKDGEAFAQIEWSSPNYDYMFVNDEKYLPVNDDGNSVFEIPVTVFDDDMEVTADTTAMSTPHEIDYTLNFDSSSIGSKK